MPLDHKVLRTRDKGGRPQLNLDMDVVARLAEVQCTYEEMAYVMGCSTDTLKRRFADLIRREREGGKTSLRRAQFLHALRGNGRMLVHLGQHWLGQTAGQRTELTGPGGGPIMIGSARDELLAKLQRMADRTEDTRLLDVVEG